MPVAKLADVTAMVQGVKESNAVINYVNDFARHRRKREMLDEVPQEIAASFIALLDAGAAPEWVVDLTDIYGMRLAAGG